MALPANKVSLTVAMVLLLLLFSAASFSVYARSRSNGKIQSSWDGRVSSATSFSVYPRSRSYGKIQSTWEDRGYKDMFTFQVNFETPWDGTKYQTFRVLLWEHPNAGEAMDDKDARRRWYESFLPSILTDSGEPRLLHCYTFDVNGFLARLTRAEALALADKPGVRGMSWDYLYIGSKRSCGFVTTTSTKRSFVRSRLAF